MQGWRAGRRAVVGLGGQWLLSYWGTGEGDWDVEMLIGWRGVGWGGVGWGGVGARCSLWLGRAGGGDSRLAFD